MQTEYTIDGNDTDGYTVTHNTSGKKWKHCPCCGKTLKTRLVAEALVVNLTVTNFARNPNVWKDPRYGK